MERRTVIQYDDYSCGPVALINAYYCLYGKYPFNCAIYKHPSKAIRKLREECSTDKIDGTRRWNISKNSIISLEKPIYNVRKILELEKFILLFSFREDNAIWAHYIFVERFSKGYRVYNYHGKQRNYNTESFTMNFLKRNPKKYELDYPLAWKIIL